MVIWHLSKSKMIQCILSLVLMILIIPAYAEIGNLGVPVLKTVKDKNGNTLIPFAILSREEKASIKVSFTILVDIVDGKRLPSSNELGAISQYLFSLEKPHERTFVEFLLPGMKPGAGAFATAHHNPKMEVDILPFFVPEKYKIHVIQLCATTNDEKLKKSCQLMP